MAFDLSIELGVPVKDLLEPFGLSTLAYYVAALRRKNRTTKQFTTSRKPRPLA